MDSKKKKVLILCNDFPPINSIGADRPYSWYKYFQEFNLYPIVITKNWQSNGNTRYNIISKEREIEYTDFGCIIRTSKVRTPSLWFQEKFKTKISFVRRGLSFIEKLLSFYFLRFDQHKGIYKEAYGYLNKNNDVHAIITTGEPFVLFKHGYRIKKQFGVRWIADYRDGWYLNHGTILNKGILSRFMRSWEYRIEKKITRDASMVVTVDPEMASRLEKLIGKKVEVVYNGFWDYYSTIEKDATKKEKIVVNHTGTLTLGQELEIFMDTLVELCRNKQINEDNFEFNLIGLEYFPEQMKRLLPYKEIVNKIVFTTPRLPKNEAVEMNLNADYLVNFTDPNLSAIYAKTYDYIACKKPILVVPGDGKLLDNLIIDNNLGFVMNSKEKLKEFIINPIENDVGLSNMNKFTRKNQCRILSDLIHRL